MSRFRRALSCLFFSFTFLPLFGVYEAAFSRSNVDDTEIWRCSPTKFVPVHPLYVVVP